MTDCSEMAEHCHAARRVIQCHQGQLPSLGLLAEMHEEAGIAVLSLVHGGREIEKDLFEGIY